MELKRRINGDLTAAMKKRDRVRTDCLRMLKTGVKNMEIEKGRELEDAEIQVVVASMIKKGKEAIQDFRKATRTDLVEKEEAQVRVLYEYLPEQLEPEDIEAVLKQVIAEVGAEGPRDLGKVMKAAMAKMAGKAPGREVSETAKRLLSA
jgi:hypothetical protein